MRLPRFPEIDAFSFWLGFLAAVAIGYALYRFRRPLLELRASLLARLSGLRQALTSGAERAIREDLLRFAQTHHLAGTQFALDDVLLPPRLWVAPPPFDPTQPPPDPEVTSVIPTLPEWPEMAAIFRAATLGPAEALAGGAPLVVLGAPGSGKTTLLAHLATRAALGDAVLFPDSPTPVFVHAADLPLPLTPYADPLQPLVAAALVRASALAAARLPRHLAARLPFNQVLVLLDGLDEVPAAMVADVAAWWAAFQQKYPKARLVAAAGLVHFGPLVRAGAAPVYLAPWGADDYRALIGKWASAWEQYIRKGRKRTTAADTDPQLIVGWLATGNLGRSIFEVTLKTWAAFAGDARGKRPVDWLEAYLLRHGVKPAGRRGLDRLAAAMFTREDQLGLARAEATALLDQALVGPAGKPLLDSDDFLDDLLSRRLLAKHGKDRIVFQHPLAAAYCVATALAVDPEAVSPGHSPAWTRALAYLSPLGDLTALVARRLGATPDLLQSDLMACAAWLRDAPSAARWRGEVFKRLNRLLMDSQQPAALRLRALGAFVAASDPTLGALFKQSLTSPDPLIRRGAVLGLGALGDVANVPGIAALFHDTDLDVRWAAVLALSALAHESALEALAQGLLTGDDNLRRACAEALARNEEEGHPVLKEAIAHDDLAVRRAAVYGLAATARDWAMGLLEKVQINEQQWLVRTAAQEVLARQKEPAARAPQAQAQAESLGWLIAWAAQQGMGVPPGPAAIEVLRRAVREGDPLTRRAAADALARLGDPSDARDLYPLLRAPEPGVADFAFNALATLAAASGTRLAATAG